MNRQEKQALAQMLISHVADIVEGWDQRIDDNPNREILKGINHVEASQTIANWLQYLPGDYWDVRLPQPQKRSS